MISKKCASWYQYRSDSLLHLDFTGGDNQSLLSDILADVEDARLSAILVLIGNDTTTIARAASFAGSCRTVVTALTLPSAAYIRAARDAAPTLHSWSRSQKVI
jgi:hypothetical protein